MSEQTVLGWSDGHCPGHAWTCGEDIMVLNFNGFFFYLMSGHVIIDLADTAHSNNLKISLRFLSAIVRFSILHHFRERSLQFQVKLKILKVILYSIFY